MVSEMGGVGGWRFSYLSLRRAEPVWDYCEILILLPALPVSGIIVRETESYYERNEMGLIEVLNRKVIGVRLYYLFNGKKIV